LEWYRAETDYLGLMDECEEMVGFVLEELGLSPVLEFQGKTLICKPWLRFLFRKL
jgi:lysyl-tRNA synthetase class 2